MELVTTDKEGKKFEKKATINRQMEMAMATVLAMQRDSNSNCNTKATLE